MSGVPGGSADGRQKFGPATGGRGNGDKNIARLAALFDSKVDTLEVGLENGDACCAVLRVDDERLANRAGE